MRIIPVYGAIIRPGAASTTGLGGTPDTGSRAFSEVRCYPAFVLQWRMTLMQALPAPPRKNAPPLLLNGARVQCPPVFLHTDIPEFEQICAHGSLIAEKSLYLQKNKVITLLDFY